jgi:hypothetical protein
MKEPVRNDGLYYVLAADLLRNHDLSQMPE